MAETTAIEWCDSTFNPVWGCQKVTAACDFCYAELLDKRTSGGKHWGPRAPRRRTSAQNWNKPRKWQREADKFFLAHGRKRRVFCASMADVFDNQWDPEWRADMWDLIRECPDLDWLLLTKRPSHIAAMLPDFWDEIKGHVWLGATIESQKAFDQSWRHLAMIDAAVLFFSMEPLLTYVDIRPALRGLVYTQGGSAFAVNKLGWVITGGESGGRNTSRPTPDGAFADIQHQCEVFGVPFLFKQWGNWDANQTYNRNKKALGRTLDGIVHDGFPNPQTFTSEA